VKRASRARTKEKTLLVYWLVPARPQRDLFAEIIRILATELKAPRFEPHLTICATADNAQTRQALKKIRGAPIRLRIAEVNASDRFTKTLFVRFHRNQALDDLNQRVRRAAKISRGFLGDPHMSLLYKRMPRSAKRELASTIKVPFREVVFDFLKAVRCNSPMKTSADVSSWRVVATKKLSG
jgi:hypothetical protein